MNENGLSSNHLNANTEEFMLLIRRLADKVKTPMHGLQGMIDLMKKIAQTPEMVEYLNIAESYNLELVSLISDCIDYVYMRSGGVQLNADWMSIEDFLKDIEGIIRPKATAKGIEFICEINEQARKWILTDFERLRQLIINLLDNALKATQKGRIEFKIDNLGVIDDQIILAFTVKDTGQGFAPETANQILLAMAQEDSQALLKIPGVGLGLLLIKELSRAMHGEISFESQPERGTTVWFTAAFTFSDKPLHEAQATYPSTSYKILLVEDNFLNQKFTRTALTKAGHLVDSAENGRLAVEKFTESQYDVILMDVQLPIMDGIEATRQIRSIENQRGGHTPIIAVTAYALDRDKARCLEAGMDLFLPKPFKPFQLLALIEKAISLKRND